MSDDRGLTGIAAHEAEMRDRLADKNREIERLRAERDSAERQVGIALRELNVTRTSLREVREALALTEQMLSKHIEEFHDFDYEPHQVPLELADLRQIQHHILGSMMDAPAVNQEERG